jgi:hypothetical protein
MKGITIMDSTQILGIISDSHGLISAFASIAKAVHDSRLEQRNNDCQNYATKETAKQFGWQYSSDKLHISLQNIENFHLEEHFRAKLAQVYQRDTADVTEPVISVWFDFYLRKIIKNPELSQYLTLHQGAEMLQGLQKLLNDNCTLLDKIGFIHQTNDKDIVKITIGGTNSKEVAGGTIGSSKHVYDRPLDVIIEIKVSDGTLWEAQTAL